MALRYLVVCLAAAAGLVFATGCLPRANAANLTIEAGGGRLVEALAAAGNGDVLMLGPGVHSGPALIDRPGIELVGSAGAIIDGGGKGQVVTIMAPDAVVRGLVIRNSGEDFDSVDAGVFVGKPGDGALIENNKIENNLFGVYLHGPDAAIVRGNEILGRAGVRMNDRGNGVHLWNSPGSIIEGNKIYSGRDGIFVTTSSGNIFRGNHFQDLRFAIHYMYTNDAEISDNVSRGNHLGYALMYSHRLVIRDNLSEGDREHGMAFNFANESQLSGNVIRRAGKKCVFLYNSNKNEITGNHFEGCEIGIHYTAGSERNIISGNAFIANQTQVKYVGSRWLDWSHAGKGNYWSDNTAFDLNGDGIADTPYKPNDLVDQVMWRHPVAKLLLTSPAVQILRWAQESFPGLHPGGVIDSAPLMHPPEIKPSIPRRYAER
ncbi:MAG: nitrous oxide reductase family maturation protein NosD [Rhodospirillaceae bacterium]|jgi:nitrous oxidase accessory protein|nr:nitrous oxide reductase family maturation protein NosD [Rhodospirillaceae bacterium]